MPRIHTTPMVRIALWALRVYLLILLSLIGLKFVRVFTSRRARPPAPRRSKPTHRSRQPRSKGTYKNRKLRATAAEQIFAGLGQSRPSSVIMF